jgi:anthranilate synthase
MEIKYLKTKTGIIIEKTESFIDYVGGIDSYAEQLDYSKGVFLSSGYEYPGRYSRWEILILNPPVEFQSFQNTFIFKANNKRGEVINSIIYNLLKDCIFVKDINIENSDVIGEINKEEKIFYEEERSKQHSVFSILRYLIQEFSSASNDIELGLIGAFGYDLIFQFEEINLKHKRLSQNKDMRLFFYDEIIKVDRQKETIKKIKFDFIKGKFSTKEISAFDGLRKFDVSYNSETKEVVEIESNHSAGEYQENVRKAREAMGRGDLFELVLHQEFRAKFKENPFQLFKKIQAINPSPYEFLIQFGDEQLVGASPEMFIRVNNKVIETCPISGTIKRGNDAMEDAELIKTLLNSGKDESELTMCTDVDRNDKSRVCIPGSVKLMGRRLIERYAGLFHTVDYVTGTLEEGYDSIDAFLSHMWAVTLTGAPKKNALQYIENLEKNARKWYGGAIGSIDFNGNINTGITIRTIHIENGTARYPVGATLHYDSKPEEEYLETLTKATSFFKVINPSSETDSNEVNLNNADLKGKKVLFVDNEDSFVHTIANYVRQIGVDVITVRWKYAANIIDEISPDMVFISPGPGIPKDFDVPSTVLKAYEKNIPIFGVCLGLQGIVEAFGGSLSRLKYPMHGKMSKVFHNDSPIFEGLPSPFECGRYHSLIANNDDFPECLEVIARSDDDVIMAIRHKFKKIVAVQFHPESILTSKNNNGLTLLGNIVRYLLKNNNEL